MADASFQTKFLWYPRMVALKRLPHGMPTGRTIQGTAQDGMNHCFVFKCIAKTEGQFLWCIEWLHGVGENPALTLSGVAPKRELGEEFRNNVLKHCPVLRSYQLTRAADHLEAWLGGTLELAPLLDISGFLRQHYLGQF